MATYHRGPIVVWALLIALTLLSYGSWWDPAWAGVKIGGSTVVVIAGVKAWLIAMRYMELGSAAWPLRLFFNVWVIVIVAVLTAMFWE